MKKLFVTIMGVMMSSSLLSFDIIAHRGASGYLPEHTLATVALAYGQGADFIEQDVVLTKDNIPVVLHDIYLDVTTNVKEIFPTKARSDGRYYVIDFTLKEIKSLKVYERFNPKTGKTVFANRFPAKMGEFNIPTLEEEIVLIQGLNRSTKRNVGIYPEIKDPEFHKSEGRDISKIVLNLLAKYNYKTKKDNFFLQIFSYEEVVRVRKELGFKGKLIQLISVNESKGNPELEKTDYSYLITEAGIKDLAQYVDGIGPWIALLVDSPRVADTTTVKDEKTRTSPLVKFAKDNKLLIHAYTVRLDNLEGFKDANVLYNFLINNAKIEGFFTDFSDDALKYRLSMKK